MSRSSYTGTSIDSEKFYSDSTSSQLLLFVEVIGAEFAAAATAFKVAGLTLVAMGTGGLIATGAGAAVLIAIAIAVAVWAPADPIIRDSIGLSVNDLAMMTEREHSRTDRRTFHPSTQGIVVNVNTSIPREGALPISREPGI